MVLCKPLFLAIPESTSQKIRILLLKATHAPLITLIWLYERWEVFQLKRAAKALGSSVFGGGTASNSSTTTTTTSDHKTKATATTLNKKHSLKTTGRVHVPTVLSASAQLRPTSKATGPPPAVPAGMGRVATGMLKSGPAVLPPVRVGTGLVSAASVPGAQSVDAVGVAELMKMMKDLSAQVEEVRAALVKHDEGPGE